MLELKKPSILLGQNVFTAYLLNEAEGVKHVVGIYIPQKVPHRGEHAFSDMISDEVTIVNKWSDEPYHSGNQTWGMSPLLVRLRINLPGRDKPPNMSPLVLLRSQERRKMKAAKPIIVRRAFKKGSSTHRRTLICRGTL
jgi:hypothetical protein